MYLEIGTGTNPQSKHIKHHDIIHVDINPNAAHLEIRCDIHFLPFIDKVFNSVFAFHVLEHLNNPLSALHEIKRVSHNCVLVVPHGHFYDDLTECNEHIFSWNAFTFRNLLERVFNNVEIDTSNLIRPAGNKFLSIFIYLKLTVLRRFLGDNELRACCS